MTSVALKFIMMVAFTMSIILAIGFVLWVPFVIMIMCGGAGIIYVILELYYSTLIAYNDAVIYVEDKIAQRKQRRRFEKWKRDYDNRD